MVGNYTPISLLPLDKVLNVLKISAKSLEKMKKREVGMQCNCKLWCLSPFSWEEHSIIILHMNKPNTMSWKASNAIWSMNNYDMISILANSQSSSYFIFLTHSHTVVGYIWSKSSLLILIWKFGTITEASIQWGRNKQSGLPKEKKENCSITLPLVLFTV